ncbi:MAG: porin family protein [Holophagales bacterium]|jgi:hypothetical protein|nr:porin family protein [Holophagales bacterium]
MRKLKILGSLLVVSASLLMPTTRLKAKAAVTGQATPEDKDALRFGAGLSYVIPVGSLSDIASAGFGLSVFGKKPLTNKFAIRGSVDYIIFGRKTDKYYVDVKHDLNKWDMAVDGIWSFAEHDSGFFALVTVGFENMLWDWYNERDREKGSKSSSGLTYGVGIGYAFNKRFSIEIILDFSPNNNWWGGLQPEDMSLLSIPKYSKATILDYISPNYIKPGYIKPGYADFLKNLVYLASQKRTPLKSDVVIPIRPVGVKTSKTEVTYERSAVAHTLADENAAGSRGRGH